MKIYISGPITGCEDYEKKFAEAEKALKAQGHIVINPAFLPEGLGDCDTYMDICFPMIYVCDIVVLLEGWEKSFECCREWGYAYANKKIIIDYNDYIDAFPPA